MQSILGFAIIFLCVFGGFALHAARIAAATVADVLAAGSPVQRVVFCCFGAASAALHRRALEALP